MSNSRNTTTAVIDFGHSIDEIFSKEKCLYFKSLPEIETFFLDHTMVGPVGYFWREEDGGKGQAQSLTCLWLALTQFSLGSGHLTVNLSFAFDTKIEKFYCWYFNKMIRKCRYVLSISFIEKKKHVWHPVSFGSREKLIQVYYVRYQLIRRAMYTANMYWNSLIIFQVLVVPYDCFLPSLSMHMSVGIVATLVTLHPYSLIIACENAWEI